MRFILCVLIFALTPCPSSAGQSLDDLRKEIAQLRTTVDPLAKTRAEPAGVDFRADLTVSPIVDLINAFAAQPVDKKKIRLDFKAIAGNIYDQYDECKIGTPFGDVKLGEHHYYMNIPNVNGFFIQTWLDNATATWTAANGLEINGKLVTQSFVPIIHGHVDATCVGGGFGFDVGPAPCDFALNVSGSAKLTGAGQGPIEFNVPTSVTGDVECHVNMGELPDLVLKLPVNQSTDLKGQLDGTVEKTGEIALQDPQLTFKRGYDLKVGPVSVTQWDRGLRVKTPIAVTFLPKP